MTSWTTTCFYYKVIDLCSKNCVALAALIVANVTLNSTVARADLVITIGDAVVAPGGSGFVDVLISSNGTDSFQNYFLDFMVGGTAQKADPVNFLPSAILAPQLTATDPDYIFLGNSAGEIDLSGIDFVSDSPGLPSADDWINVMDMTDSSADRTIALEDGSFLLARLNFEAPVSATLGNVYAISLDFGDFRDTAELSLDFSSNIGSITIGASAVPEPSSFALIALSSIAWSVRRFRRRHLHGLASLESNVL